MLKTGTRELRALLQQYTVHPFDEPLGVFFAQARIYDAGDRRFLAVDAFRGWIAFPETLNPYAYCINNPLIYIDPTGWIIVLKGDADERQLLLNTLRKLTDDTIDLHEVEVPIIPPATQYRVIIMQENEGNLPIGTSLIRKLILNPSALVLNHGYNRGQVNYVTPFRGMYFAGATDGTGTSATINFDTRSRVNVLTIDSNGIIAERRVPDYIILGHEMVHAYHIMTGTMIPPRIRAMSIYRDSANGGALIHLASAEELRTIGVSYFPLIVCEDDINRPTGMLWWRRHNVTRSDYGEMVGFSSTVFSENALRVEHGLPLRIAYGRRAGDLIARVNWNEAMGIFPEFRFPVYPT